MTPRFLFAFVAAALFYAGCSSGPVQITQLTDYTKTFSLTSLPTQDSYPEADAIVLSCIDSQMIYWDKMELTGFRYYRRAVKVFKNFEKYSTAEVAMGSTHKLSSLQAAVISPDGNQTMLQPSDFLTVKAEQGTEGSGPKVDIIRFTFPKVQKGSILVYAYHMFDSDPGVSQTWDVQEKIPVLSTRISLTLPIILLELNSVVPGVKSLNWKYKSYNFDIGKASVDNHQKENESKIDIEKLITFSWQQDNVDAFIEEPYTFPDADLKKYVDIEPSEYSGWFAVGSPIGRGLTKWQKSDSKLLKTAVDTLSKNAKTRLDTITALYNFVQSFKTINPGSSGRSKSPDVEDVFEAREGTKFHKTSLFVTLLKAAGIPVYNVLVNENSYLGFDREFPVPDYESRIAKVYADSATVLWCDVNGENLKPGELPAKYYGMNVLVLEPVFIHLEKITETKYTDNRIDISAALKVSPDDVSEMSADILFRGLDEKYYRNYFTDKSPKDIKDFCRTLFSGNFGSPVVTDYKLSEPDTGTGYRLTFTMKLENALEKQGDLYFLNECSYNFSRLFSFLNKTTRVHPVLFDYPSTVKYNLSVELPEGFSLHTKPENFKLNGDLVQYTKVVSPVGENSIFFSNMFMLKKRVVETERYKDLTKNYQDIKKRDAERTVLTKK